MNNNTMEKRTKERIERLEMLLNSIKSCTQPIEGHTDPNSIEDCWNEVEDYIKAIKSGIRRDIFKTWLTAINRCINKIQINYLDVIEILGITDYVIKDDNNPNELGFIERDKVDF